MQVLAVVLAVAAVVPALAQITTFANIGCSGASAVFPCDGSCNSFVGKRAFATVAGATHCVTIFTDANCTNIYFPNVNQHGQCTAIEAGDPTPAFSCSTDSTCATV
ncbi:hypothetical protein C8J57DRAFT_1325723 [Mycena rebaudengoi]|nr:hypothetical protein C8J57DRAFT_1325723 [Mycena rebaudengoi]